MVTEQTLSVRCWNVFHGRDHPPDPGLFTARSRLLGAGEDNGHHLQANRSLVDEFARLG